MIVQQQSSLPSSASQNSFWRQNHRKRIPQNQFVFPSEQLLFTEFQQLREPRIMLNTINNPDNQILFKSKILRNKYLYFTCKYCRAYVNYKLNQSNKVEVCGYQNVHIHESLQFKKIQELKILQFISTLKGNRTDIKNIVLSKFNISNRRFYYIINKSERNIRFEDLLIQLERRGYDMLYQKQSESNYPQLFLYSTPEMAKMYRLFGDFCTFDITYNLLKERNTDKKQWGVGVFTGKDSNMRILIFAIALISNESTTSMQKVFQGFFKLYHKQPQVIITDEQLSTISALENLKKKKLFHGHHIFDIFHILKNIRKKTQKKQFFIYKKLVKDRNFQSFQLTVTRALNQNISQQVLQKFLQQKAKNCCYSLIPEVFVGFSVSNSINQKINDIIKGFIPRQAHWITFFNKIDRVIKHLQLNTKTKLFQFKPYQKLFKDGGILQVRRKVQKKVFQQFISNYVRAFRLNCQKIRSNQYKCWSHKENWTIIDHSCKCGVLWKSGVPCEHLIRICWVEGKYEYINLFNPRWIVSEQKKIETRGRPKNSRKNLIK